MLLQTNLTLRPVLNQFLANLQCVAVIQRTVGKQKTCDTFVRLQVGENVQNPGIVCIAFWWSFIVCPTAVVFQVLIIPAFQIEGRICHYVVKIQALVQVICKCRCRAVSRATLSWGAGVLMIVDHRASTGRAYAPSVRVASSKNARIMFSSSGSNPSSSNLCRSQIPPAYGGSPGRGGGAKDSPFPEAYQSSATHRQAATRRSREQEALAGLVEGRQMAGRPVRGKRCLLYSWWAFCPLV